METPCKIQFWIQISLACWYLCQWSSLSAGLSYKYDHYFRFGKGKVSSTSFTSYAKRRGFLWLSSNRGLDGCLSFARNGDEIEAFCSEVWLLKKNDNCYENKELQEHQLMGWSEEFRVFRSKFIALMKIYDVLSYGDNHINIHNPKASTSERILDFT